MTINLTIVRQMVHQCMSMGVLPAQLQMTEATRADVFAVAPATDVTKPSYSSLHRWWMRVRNIPEAPWTLFGIPIVINPLLPHTTIVVRPIHTLGRENWLEEISANGMRQMLECQSNQAAVLEHQPAPELVKAAEGVMGRTAGKSVTDILIDATTNCDDIRTVIVITVAHNNEVTMRGNADRFGMYGILTAVMSRMDCGE